MKFLFIASGRTAPSTRFRIEQFLPALRKAGHQCDVAYSFPEKYDHFRWLGWRISQWLKRRVRLWHAWRAKVNQYDSIFIEREVFDNDTSDLEERFRRLTKRLVLDVDDGVFLRHKEKFDTIAKLSDVAIAGNECLREYLKPLCDEIVLIPTCIRMADYPQKQREPDDAVATIGWMGTTHNVPFLSVAAPAMRSLAQRHRFRLLIVATTDERLPDVDLSGVEVEFRNWDPNREVADLLEMDIGLMPLPDGQDWMKYKCGLKLLQYLAIGIPGVASPIGVNGEIMEGEKVGRSASTDEEWETALEELMTDTDLRLKLGAAGRELVQKRFSVEANWQVLERVLCGSNQSD